MNVVKYLGHGMGRAVALLENNIIVKVPFNSSGYLQNQSEFEKFTNKPNKFYASISKYDESNGFLYMEYVNDQRKYFKSYLDDKVYCSKYDENPICTNYDCGAKCKKCEYNTLMEHIPSNYGKIIKQDMKDITQVGIDVEGNYKFYDYADLYIPQENEFKFYDSWGKLLVEYLENEVEETFDVFVKKIVSDNEGFDIKSNYEIASIRRKHYCKIILK